MGFPPKICALLLEEMFMIYNMKRQKVRILDIGCGKGYLGEYLKEAGFLQMTGIDNSKTLLGSAEEKKAY